jgi:hypothetical protein
MVPAANQRGIRMAKLRILLKAALLTALSMLALASAGAVTSTADSGTRLETTSILDCCWIFYMGRWWCIPC